MHTPSTLWHRHTTIALQGALFNIAGIVTLSHLCHSPTNLSLDHAQLWFGTLLGATPFLLRKKVLLFIALFFLGAFRFLWAIEPLHPHSTPPEGPFSGEVQFYQPPRYEKSSFAVQKVMWQKQQLILKTDPPLKPGEEMHIQGEWRVAQPTTYPWDPSPEKAFLERSIDTVQVTSMHVVKQAKYTEAYRVITQQLTHLSPNAQSLYAASILGERYKLTPRVEAILQETGMAHFLAISGLHVALMASLILACLWILPLPVMYRQIVGMFAIWSLILFTGPSASTCRALTMLSIVLLAPLLGRRVFSLNTLGFSALGYLVIFPLDLFSISFQLSFSAVFAILSTLPLLQKFPRKLVWLASPVLVSLSATIGTLPILIIHFGSWVPGGILFNIVILPILSLLYQCIIVTLLIPVQPLQIWLLSLLDYGTQTLLLIMEQGALFLNIRPVATPPIFGWWMAALMCPPLIMVLFGPPHRVLFRVISTTIVTALAFSLFYGATQPSEAYTWRRKTSWFCVYKERSNTLGIIYLAKDEIKKFPSRAFLQWIDSQNATILILTDEGVTPPRVLTEENDSIKSRFSHRYLHSSSYRFSLITGATSLCFDRSFQDFVIIKNKNNKFFFDFYSHKTVVSIISGTKITPAEEFNHYHLATKSHE